MTLRATRRRFLCVAGAAAGWSLFPVPGRADAPAHLWRGQALGAHATIRLVHPNAGEARRLIDLCVAEIERLERVFSLYRADSALSRLNAAGALDLPPLELVELFDRGASASAATGGAFDVTVQPLWSRYAAHFAAPGVGESVPDISDVLPLVDWRGVQVAPDRIAFARPGMAVTLNGIAQGYITDRVAELLRANGIVDLLLDLGEVRALGTRPDGQAWRVGLADPADPARAALILPLRNLAVATSGGYGMMFDAGGRYGHILDPRSGRPAPVQRSVSVVAPDATTADSLSTAAVMLTPEAIKTALMRLGAIEAHLLGPEGHVRIAA